MSIRGAEGAGPSGEGDGRDGERRAGGGSRVHFEALVAVGEDAGGSFEAESVDVSPDGMRLRTAYLPAEGDKLVCRFDGLGSEIVAEGEVLWRREEAKGGEFGLRFVGLDEPTAGALRAMCMTLGDAGPDGAEGEGGDGERPSAEEPIVPRGARVRLHIEGLGSPMKARVRESASRELSVGSNLEFLKVGRALELEDVDQGSKREATIDDVKVDVDPATRVPQLVVTLRFDRASADGKPDGKQDRQDKQERTRASALPATRRTPAPETRATEARRASVPPKTERMPSRAPIAPHDEADASDPVAAGFAARAAVAGRAVAGRVGPVLAGVGARARGAMLGAMALYEKRIADRADDRKASAPRRTTAPPPGGALTSDGRRLVRDEAISEDEISLPMRSNRRAAATGGALGLLVVLGIFGAARLMGRGHADGASASAPSDMHTAVAMLPPAPEPVAAAGTPTASVPLFGATPLSTTEPAHDPNATAPSALASAAPAAPSARRRRGRPGPRRRTHPQGVGSGLRAAPGRAQDQDGRPHREDQRRRRRDGLHHLRPWPALGVHRVRPDPQGQAPRVGERGEHVPRRRGDRAVQGRRARLPRPREGRPARDRHRQGGPRQGRQVEEKEEEGARGRVARRAGPRRNLLFPHPFSAKSRSRNGLRSVPRGSIRPRSSAKRSKLGQTRRSSPAPALNCLPQCGRPPHASISSSKRSK